MQYNTIQYNTIQYNTIQYNAIQYNSIQYNTIQNKTIQYNLMQFVTFHSCGIDNLIAGHSAGGAVGAYMAMMLEVRKWLSYFFL